MITFCQVSIESGSKTTPRVTEYCFVPASATLMTFGMRITHCGRYLSQPSPFPEARCMQSLSRGLQRTFLISERTIWFCIGMSEQRRFTEMSERDRVPHKPLNTHRCHTFPWPRLVPHSATPRGSVTPLISRDHTLAGITSLVYTTALKDRHCILTVGEGAIKVERWVKKALRMEKGSGS